MANFRCLILLSPLILALIAWGIKYRIEHPPVTEGDLILRRWASQSDSLRFQMSDWQAGSQSYDVLVPRGKNLWTDGSSIVQELHLSPWAAPIPAGYYAIGDQYFRPYRFMKGTKIIGMGKWYDTGNGVCLTAGGKFWRVKPLSWHRFNRRMQREGSWSGAK